MCWVLVETSCRVCMEATTEVQWLEPCGVNGCTQDTPGVSQEECLNFTPVALHNFCDQHIGFRCERCLAEGNPQCDFDSPELDSCLQCRESGHVCELPLHYDDVQCVRCERYGADMLQMLCRWVQYDNGARAPKCEVCARDEKQCVTYRVQMPGCMRCRQNQRECTLSTKDGRVSNACYPCASRHLRCRWQ